jgi:tRNA-dihydrouridine synthase
MKFNNFKNNCNICNKQQNNKIIFYFPPINKLGNIAFRKTALYYGADYVFTEMINLDKLLVDDEPTKLKIYVDKEDISKTIFQVISSNIENISLGIEKLIAILKDSGIINNPNEIFEINYNMGCPHSSLHKNFCGGGILKNKELLKLVSLNFKSICNKYNINCSIKTRVGITKNDNSLSSIFSIFKEVGIHKIYLHGRLITENYVYKAHYDEVLNMIKNNKTVLNKFEIILNGDIVSYNSLKKVINLFDGKINSVMVGRAALKNPKIFYYLKQGIPFEFNLNGDDIYKRKEQMLIFLNYATHYKISLNKIKSNLIYMSQDTKDGSEFRRKLNEIKDVKEIFYLLEKI